jgi:hypothetical protein
VSAFSQSALQRREGNPEFGGRSLTMTAVTRQHGTDVRDFAHIERAATGESLQADGCTHGVREILDVDL